METSCYFGSNSLVCKSSDRPLPKPPKLFFPVQKKRSCFVASCSAGKSDDNSTPLIRSDWRSFRARLVAGEEAAAGGGVGGVGERWAHALHEPEKGCLLIATDKLDGVHIFDRTVILLLSAGRRGPAGVIINRPSLMSIKESRSADLDPTGTFLGRPLFFGGPLEGGLFLVGPRANGAVADESDDVGRTGIFEEVMRGLYYGTKESLGCAAEMVKRSVVGVREFRFFDGYCGWDKEQLRGEIKAGFWHVAACSPSVLALDSVERGGFREELLSLLGENRVW